jgi:hypothetical protein
MAKKSNLTKSSIGNLPRFSLARTSPKVGLLVIPDAKERAEFHCAIEASRKFVNELANRPHVTIHIEHRAVSSNYLDRLAELYARCEFVYLTSNSFFAGEPFFTEFWNSIEDAEQDVTYAFTAILVVQSRLRLCHPSLMQQAPYALANPGAKGPQLYIH